MKILVCDDKADSRDSVIEALRRVGYTPDTLIDGALSAELRKLFSRVDSSRKSGAENYHHEPSRFDQVDILILDNNLAFLPNEGGPPLTAESIAGYIRAYTTACYIVSLNMNLDVDFDLRYLVGDFSTRADLAINTSHLRSRALWTHRAADSQNGFCPWYWPALDSVAQRRRAQVDFVRDHLGDSVLETFGFDDEEVEFMTLHARGALSPDASVSTSAQGAGKPLREVKFRDVFLTKDRSLPLKDEREQLAAAERHAPIRDLMARVVAADIDLWFRRDLVGPQEPLMDVPHMVMRFPFLLGARAGQVEEWNKVVEATGPPFALEPELYEKYIAPRFFREEIWSPTPCFRWPRLKADEKLNEHFFQSKEHAWADVVFCEDESRFRNRAGEDRETGPVEFTAEFEGAWNRRYISKIDHVQYAPRTRLAV